ncbi:hypothetical protein PMAYCL1PPCAC_07518, partial [Pristionchus mayeri]
EAMSYMPLDFDDYPEVKKEVLETEKNVSEELATARTEIGRLQKLYTKACVDLKSARKQMDVTAMETTKRHMELETAVTYLENEVNQLHSQKQKSPPSFQLDRTIEMKDLMEEKEKLKEEATTLRDEMKRLQRHVAMLKEQKKETTKKYDDLKEKMQAMMVEGVEESQVKEREKMKMRIKQIMAENMRLMEEKQSRLMPGYSTNDSDALNVENKRIREELKSSLEMRQKLNDTVEKYESTNAQLKKQLEWYKHGWLTYHEIARQNMNAMDENDFLPPLSFPMPDINFGKPRSFCDSPSNILPYPGHPPLPPRYPPKKIIKKETHNTYIKTEIEEETVNYFP